MTIRAQTTFDEPVDVLNYALTLEHLEYAFYRDGLEEFTAEDFTRLATPQCLSLFGDIRDHEMDHVNTITSVITDLGGEPVAEASTTSATPIWPASLAWRKPWRTLASAPTRAPPSS